MTKKEKYNAVIDYLNEKGKEEFVTFLQGEVAALERKAEKAKIKAAEKKNEPDPLVDQLQAALTSEFQSIAEIVAATGNEELTPSKAVYRLGTLVRNGVAEKGKISVGEPKKKLSAYKLRD